MDQFLYTQHRRRLGEMVGKLSRVILRPIAIQSFQDFPDAGVEADLSAS